MCETVLGCGVERLHNIGKFSREGLTRNSQWGSNINTANIVAAMFIAGGQDAGSVVESSWSYLTADYD